MSKAQVDGKLRTEGRCRLCHRSSEVRQLTRHRVVPGQFGGRYEPINCVPLCRPCHDLVDHKDWTVRRPARRMLRASLWPMEIAHATRVRWWQGHGHLDRLWNFDVAYPRPTRELVLERRAVVAAAV